MKPKSDEHDTSPKSEGGDDQSGRSREDAASALGKLQTRCADLDARRGSCTDETEWINLQSKSLVSWAREDRWLLDASQVKALTSHLQRLEGSSEHRVMYQPGDGRVIKVTNPPCFGLRCYLAEYLNNIRWSNELFGDDIRIEGVLDLPEGASIVISQPFISGRAPTDAEIEEWFQAQGFEKKGHHGWIHPKTGCHIRDAHTGNFVVNSEMEMIPIDLQVLNPGSPAQ